MSEILILKYRNGKTLSLDNRWDRDDEIELCVETSDGEQSFYLTRQNAERMRDHLTAMLATRRPAAPEVKP